MDRFAQELGEAERSRAVKIAKGAGATATDRARETRGRFAPLRIPGRRPARELADEAASRLMNGLDLPAEFEAAQHRYSPRGAGGGLGRVSRLMTSIVCGRRSP